MTRSDPERNALARAAAGLPADPTDAASAGIPAALHRFLAWRDAGGVSPPGPDEPRTYLAELRRSRGDIEAFREVAALLPAAGALWGPAAAAPFSRALRAARCRSKPARRDEWARAAIAVRGLPEPWRAPFEERVARGRRGSTAPRLGAEPWSASHLEAVARALRGWAAFRGEIGGATRPTGASLDAYAAALVAEGCTLRTVADYLGRTHTGFAVVLEPGFASEGCRFVIDDWDRRARRVGATTKAAAGVVPASRLYELGIDLMEAARRRPYHGLAAARDYRDGLLLAVAAALPQRARALAALDLATTFRVADRPTIKIHLPGRVLKMRERRKAGRSFSRTLSNERLWAALDEYARAYRPLFDGGTALFPSTRSPGAAISEAQLERLVRGLTVRHLGVAVSIHRVRDCVATEAAERMPQGGRLASALLDHADPAVTEAHYTHAEGVRAATALAEHLAARQRPRARLLR